MSLVVWHVDGCAMCKQLACDHVLTVEAGNMEARVTVATHCIHLDSVVKQQPDNIDLTTRGCRVKGREHLNVAHDIPVVLKLLSTS